MTSREKSWPISPPNSFHFAFPPEIPVPNPPHRAELGGVRARVQRVGAEAEGPEP